MMKEIYEKAYFKSLEQLENGIRQADQKTYSMKLSGRYVWQQALHTLMGSYFWFRLEKTKFVEPFKDQGYEPEFLNEPRNQIPKNDLLLFLEDVKARSLAFFSHEDEWFLNDNVIYSKKNNLEVAFMQMRHMMYHVGYLSACLMQGSSPQKIEWID